MKFISSSITTKSLVAMAEFFSSVFNWDLRFEGESAKLYDEEERQLPLEFFETREVIASDIVINIELSEDETAEELKQRYDFYLFKLKKDGQATMSIKRMTQFMVKGFLKDPDGRTWEVTSNETRINPFLKNNLSPKTAQKH